MSPKTPNGFTPQTLHWYEGILGRFPGEHRLKFVQFAILPFQVAEIRGGLQWTTSDPVDQLVGIVPGPVSVDVLPKPLVEDGELTLFNLSGNLRSLADRLGGDAPYATTLRCTASMRPWLPEHRTGA